MIQLIPLPQKVSQLTGTFRLTQDTSCYFAPELQAVSHFFEELVAKAARFPLQNGNEMADIRFLYNACIPKEGYQLDCTQSGIAVSSSTPAGAFYAIQTLRQLLKLDTTQNAAALSMACVKIEDAPRFCWRGMMLDSSRYFWSVDYVKRYLDFMAMHKLNVFHWHLTDDVGWRIEIKKYPLLTEIGSKRKDTQLYGWKSKRLEGKPYAPGFYTQEQIREIVAYAAERFIMVVPEIDMPAHFAAAIAGYPYLACREIPGEVHWFYGKTIPEKTLNWKDWNRPACAGKESTYQFIFDIIDEIAPLFPAPYFHIGGDEAPKDEWKTCPHCQKAIQEHGLKDVEELQGLFNNRIAAHLKEKGKRLIVWNEALQAGNLDKSVVGQYWTPQRDKFAKKYINEGGEMIMSRHQAFYFDMTYAQRPLQNTYKFEPVQGGIRSESVKNVLGVEAEMWTEFIPSVRRLEMFLFPRMQALSEVAWSPKEKRDFKSFLARWEQFKPILDAFGANYAENSVALAKNPIRRLNSLIKFQYGNPSYELDWNDQLQSQKK